jgi:hypothetical protein
MSRNNAPELLPVYPYEIFIGCMDTPALADYDVMRTSWHVLVI